MEHIESVRVYLSPHNIRDGKDIGPGLAVVIDPWPDDEKDVIQIGDNITATVKAYNGK